MLLAIQGLTKHYRRLVALQPCDLVVKPGEVFGLLGPNGAGKTTLLRLVMGFLRPSGGTAQVAGFDCWRNQSQVHQRTAYLPGEVRLIRSMSGRELLTLFARMRPGGDPARSLALAQRLEVDLSRRVSACSSGMRQKLALAMTLASDVPLVILDEPTNHLDPTARLEVIRLVREARDAGRAVVFSSHVFEEADRVCDRVGLLRRGALVAETNVGEVRSQHLVTARPRGQVGQVPPELVARVTPIEAPPERLAWQIQGELHDCLGWLAQQPLSDLQIESMGLQAIYERLYGLKQE